MIVARSSNFSDPELDIVVEGQANPMRRDVFQIPPGESITLRVVADNPGTWFLHCKSPVSLSFFSFFPPIISIHCSLIVFRYRDRSHRMASRSRISNAIHRSSSSSSTT